METMEANVISEDFIRTKDAVSLTGYTQEYIRQLWRQGKVAGRKFGSVVMISKSSLLEYYSKQEGKR